jgi:nitrite reductase/ring-hydroxylating ferredoxin subunit
VKSMGNFVKAGGTSEFQDGSKRKVTIEGHEILLARVGDKYYAVGSRCPHMGGDLAAGQLKGTIVTCPLHGSQFDISNGSVVRWLKGSGLISAVGKVLKSPRTLPTYSVKVDGDAILIEV